MSFTPEAIDQIKYLLEEGERISEDARSRGREYCFIPTKTANRNLQRCVLQTPSSRIVVTQHDLGEKPLQVINYDIRPNPHFLDNVGGIFECTP